MQLRDGFCYFVLTITIATSFVQADEQKQELTETKSIKRVSKRDAAIFIDSFPIEPIYRHRPKIIYRRISKQRYKSPKPKYGPPPMYRSKSRKPVKKYKGNVKPKYGPPSYKRRPTKPKYGPPKMKYKPVYGPPKTAPQSYFTQEPAGFGEPPEILDYPSKQTFGEPPLDSYGSPVNEDVINPYIPDEFSPPSYSDPLTFDNLGGSNFGQNMFTPWEDMKEQNYDTSGAYSKKQPTYLKPEYDADDITFSKKRPFNKPEHFDTDDIVYSKQRPTNIKSELYDLEDPTYSKKRPIFVKSNPFDTDDEVYLKKRPTVLKPETLDSEDVTYTKKRPMVVKPVTYTAKEDVDLNPYSHIYIHGENIDEEPIKIKRKPYYLGETIKLKSRKPKPSEEADDDVLVGGRYAEPPARFVPKYQQTFSLHTEDNDFTPLKGFVDPDIAISATMSPYVNYKHSNVAFSPQNLNDAFSIVDK